jgi:hypothetical protein
MFLTVQKMRLLEPLQRSEEYSSLCNHVTSTSEMFGSRFGDLSSQKKKKKKKNFTPVPSCTLR